MAVLRSTAATVVVVNAATVVEALLRALVHAWSGNRCQAFQVDLERLAEHVSVRDPLVEEWERDAITLMGEDPRAIVRRLLVRGADG